MWSPDGPEEPSFDDIAQLLRWGRAQRISLHSYDLLAFDDDELFALVTRRTRPRYKTERRTSRRDRNAE